MIRAVHRFLLPRTFYPLLLCTLLGLAFLTTRVVIAREIRFSFLVWNLFLAWIPYGFSLYALHLRENRPDARWLIAMTWLGWLVMFPNAPYILTDFVHLHDAHWRLPWWFDLGLVITFALAGCFLGIVSLRIMHDLARPRIGEIGGWLFVAAVAILSGFGIYLGRFGRFNSWDVLIRPHHIIQLTITRLLDPLSHLRAIGMTLMFGAMVLMIYVMFVSSQKLVLVAEEK